MSETTETTPNAPTAGDALSAEQIADRIIQSVCELDPTDYPEDDRDTLKTSDRDLRIIVERHVAAALLAARREGERDTARLNWLETKVVNVREPLRYGSLDIFWASPENEDADTSYAPSDIRKAIDAALAATPEER